MSDSSSPIPEAIQQALGQAVAHYQRGELEAAVAALQAHDGVALTQGVGWNLMGAIRLAQRQPQDALAAFESSVRLAPQAAEPRANLGLALISMGRWSDALAALEASIALNPNDPAALGNQGLCLHRLGRLEEARAALDRALALQPGDPAARANRGDVLLELDRPAEALADYDAALVGQPERARTHNNRGISLIALERPVEARAAFDRALTLQPAYAEALINRSLLALEAELFGPALADLEAALRLAADNPRALAGRAQALEGLERFEEADRAFVRALEPAPDDTELLRRHGNVLRELNRIDEAMAAYQRVLAINPSDPATLFSRGTIRLLRGDLAGGYADQEARWDTADFQGLRPPCDAPFWIGEDLSDKHLLVHVEQGLGDCLQFVRFLEPLRQRCGALSLLVKPMMRRLLAPSLPDVTLIDWPAAGPLPGSFDVQVALMSLPHRLGLSEAALCPRTPYLAAEPERVAHWRERIGSEGFKIGVCWQGNPQGLIDRGRSFALAGLAPLAALPGLRLISLQKDHGLEQLDSLPAGMTVERLGDDFDAGPDAFVDSAAVIEGLDLVVTCDTAIAHLAGALDRSAWVALKTVPDWRWRLDGAETPWYPSLRLFRQPARGDWDAVFAAMAEALSAQLRRQ